MSLVSQFVTARQTHGITDEVRTQGTRLVKQLSKYMSHREVSTVLGISPSTVSTWRNS